MNEIAIRVLTDAEWELYRTVRLGALTESPDAFTATLADESAAGAEFWHDRMARSRRLLAERGAEPQGIVSLGPYAEEPDCGEVFGLYVFPEARGTGVSWALVEAAAALATQDGYRKLFYWVGVDNPRAIGFAKNFGFGLTGQRRAARQNDLVLGDQEIAMVLTLVDDARTAPNPTGARPAQREGPVG
jgi:GNAT superfamily N-acetyltransferase